MIDTNKSTLVWLKLKLTDRVGFELSFLLCIDLLSNENSICVKDRYSYCTNAIDVQQSSKISKSQDQMLSSFPIICPLDLSKRPYNKLMNIQRNFSLNPSHAKNGQK